MRTVCGRRRRRVEIESQQRTVCAHIEAVAIHAGQLHVKHVAVVRIAAVFAHVIGVVRIHMRNHICLGRREVRCGRPVCVGGDPLDVTETTDPVQRLRPDAMEDEVA